MGLEAVELIMEVEDTFGITIQDEEVARCETAGELYELVLDKLVERDYGVSAGEAQRSKPIVLLSEVALCRVIEALRAERGDDVAAIEAETPLAAIIPRKGRRALWRRLASRLRSAGLKLPPLERRGGVVLVLSLAVLVAAISLWEAMSERWGLCVTALPAAALSLALGLLAAWLSRPLRVHFPYKCTTVRHLAGHTLGVSIEKGMVDVAAMRLARRDVWVVLVHVIAETLGEPADRIQPETHFVRDLDVG